MPSVPARRDPGTTLIRIQSTSGRALAAALAVAGESPAMLERYVARISSTEPLAQPIRLDGLHAIRRNDWPTGPDAPWILLPFSAPGPSRWSASGGCWYGARTETTARLEVAHHVADACRREALPPGTTFPRLVVDATLSDWPLDDLTMATAQDTRLHASDYGMSQAYGAQRRREDASGLWWPSVRDPARRACVVAFRPVALASAQPRATPLTATWTGDAVSWTTVTP